MAKRSCINYVFGSAKAAQTAAKRGDKRTVSKLPTSLDEFREVFDDKLGSTNAKRKTDANVNDK